MVTLLLMLLAAGCDPAGVLRSAVGPEVHRGLPSADAGTEAEAGAGAEAEATKRMVLHTYEVRFRLNGRVSTTRVQASDAGHAKQLVQAQYGDAVTVLSTKRVD